MSTTAGVTSPSGLYTQMNDRLVAANADIATGVYHRSDGGFATYRDYGIRDWIKGTEPTYSGDYGKQVRTGNTPVRTWDEVRPLSIIAEHDRGIASFEDALAGAVGVSKPSHWTRPGNEIYGAVLEDSGNTFRVISTHFSPKSSERSGAFVDTNIQKLFRQLGGNGGDDVRAAVRELGPTLRALTSGGEMPGILTFARKLI